MNSEKRKAWKKKTFTENVVLVLALVSAIFLLSVSFVSGAVSIDSISIPSSVDEMEDIYMNFIASSDSPNPISYSIYRNGILVSSNEEYAESTNYTSSGTYTYLFVASDIDTNYTETRQLDIVDIPLLILSSSPTNKTYNNRTIPINMSLSLEVDTCVYSTNNSMSGMLAGSGQFFYSGVTFSSDGSYTMDINCSNEYESKTKRALFHIDTQSPAIVSKNYVINTDNTVTFSLTTDTVAMCKYDLSDKSFDSMLYTFANTNNIQHHTTLSGLLEGSHNYYIKCRNVNNNVGPAETISFSLIIKPTAVISLSKDSPLKAGTYEVRLTTSENVLSAPSLYYTFSGDSTQRFVTLTGSGSNWEGYMIIDANTANMVGTFVYSGVDMNNNVGNVITSGQLFLVDTTAPAAPISIEAEPQSDGRIKVKWYYDGEEADRYNIYRTIGGDPEYVDYHDSTTSRQYVDEEVVDGITYYYRIAAIDAADNDGYLSDVVSATAAYRPSSNNYNDNSGNIDVETPEEEFLDEELIPKVDQLIEELNTYIADIEIIKSDIDSINDPVKLKIINLLGISETISTSKANIEASINEANDFKVKQMTRAELDIALNKIKMDAIKQKSLIAEDILVNEQSSYEQITQSSDVDFAISESVTVNLTKSVLTDYATANKKIQDSISVDTEIIIFKIKYFGKDDYDKYTLVIKNVDSSLELSGVSVIELIPKSFERDVKDISFEFKDQTAPIVVKSDPVVRWDFDSFNKMSIYYMINNHAEMSAAKETKTIVLLKPDFKVTDTTSGIEEEQSNILTGLVGLDIAGFELTPMHWMILAGIGMILGLSAYYVSLDKKEKNAFEKESSRSNGSSGNGSSKSGSGIFKGLKANLAKQISRLDSKTNSSSLNKSHLSSTDANINSNVLLKVESQTSHNHIHQSSHQKDAGHQDINSNKVHHATVQIKSHETPAEKQQAYNAKFNSKHTYDYMSRQLDVANILINSFEYEKCRTIYNHCVDYYKMHKFHSAKEKQNFKTMIDHLYMKLFAYRLIHVSRKATKAEIKKNVEALGKISGKLSSTLDDIAEEYRDDEKKFIDYISHSRNHLHKHSS
ncbi:MAG TPA: hypothetical protein VEC16_05060 [Alphaproteobacteria bacterium]|nr:hypothetical protein [Alphaproteobacteria bacterium]